MTRRRIRIPILDIILLSSIGISALAWFIQRKKRRALPPPPRQSQPDTKGVVTQMDDDERNFVNMMKEQKRRVIFFYGSQTGTAEDYASRLAKQCTQTYGVDCLVADIEEYDLSYLDKVPEDSLVVFVMATYGEGEPTDNAVDFWDLITQEIPQFSENTDGDENSLNNLKYIVFGLGNKTYEHYNSVIRTLDKRLLELGAQRVGERGEGDDDGSLEEDFLGWQEDMWPAFCDALGIDKDDLKAGSRQPVYSVQELLEYDQDKVYFGELSETLKAQARGIYDAKRPYIAPLTSYDLFKGGDRHCLHIEIDVTGSGLHYDTGDHVAIWPTNNDVEVERLAKMVGIYEKLDTVIRVQAIDQAASKKFPFPVPATYRAILRHYIDICATISRSTLMSFVEFAPSEKAKEKLQRLGTDKEAYRIEIGDVTRNLGEVLEMVSEDGELFDAVPFDLIVESISRLQPRYYSISSSSKEDPHKISVTAVTLQYDASGRTVYGVNTNYLWRIHEALNGLEPNNTIPLYNIHGPRNSFYQDNSKVVKVPVHVRHSQFKLPRNNEIPIIMIGPGTGVAPFRGFVRERVLNKKQGKNVGTTVLFFGCRSAQQDFLYENEWPELFEALGDKSRIITAFSRDTDKKVYVQHRLMEHGEEMWELLNKGAYVYVCGDAKVMARDVNQTFVKFAETFGGLDEEKAHDYVKNLRSIGRYQEDVWS